MANYSRTRGTRQISSINIRLTSINSSHCRTTQGPSITRRTLQTHFSSSSNPWDMIQGILRPHLANRCLRPSNTRSPLQEAISPTSIIQAQHPPRLQVIGVARYHIRPNLTPTSTPKLRPSTHPTHPTSSIAPSQTIPSSITSPHLDIVLHSVPPHSTLLTPPLPEQPLQQPHLGSSPPKPAANSPLPTSTKWN